MSVPLQLEAMPPREREEHPAVVVTRLLLGWSGTLVLALTGHLSGEFAAGAMVLIAVPASVGQLRGIVDAVKGRG